MADWEWELQPTFEGLIRALEIMSCGLLVENAEGIIRYGNARILEWTGYRQKELDGKPTALIVPPELHDTLVDERQRVLDGDLRARLSSVRRKDGRTFPIVVAPQPIARVATGEPLILCVLIDLGEVHTARPLGTPENGLAAELARVALKLQSLSYSAAFTSEGTFPVDHPLLRKLSAREREVLGLLARGHASPRSRKSCSSARTPCATT